MIGFWKVQQPYGQFSNWWLCNIIYDNKTFCSSEQVFMYMKAKLFKDDEVAEKILQTTNQKTIKALGREVKNFDQLIWDNFKYSLMYNANELKFSQNPDLKMLLLSTGNEQICEASPLDRIWGIGLSTATLDYRDPTKWRGQNLLGQVLINLREAYKERV